MFCDVSDANSGGSSLLHLRWEPLDGPSVPQAGATEILQRRRDFCARMTPRWRVDGRGAWLDLGGMERLHGSWVDGAVQVSGRARREFPVWSAGLASSALAARLASRVAARWAPHQALAVPPASVPRFLAGFSVQALGVDPGLVARLRPLGVHSLGDLQLIPQTLLTAVFGNQGRLLSRAAWGQLDSTSFFAPREPRPRLVARVVLDRPLASAPGVRALKCALALRALAWKDQRAGTTGRWSLVVQWSGGARARVGTKAPGRDTRVAWSELVDTLWRKLPSHRQGIQQVDMLFQAGVGESFRQLDLFDQSSGADALVRVMKKIRQEADTSFAAASESLLLAWGARWFPADGREVEQE